MKWIFPALLCLVWWGCRSEGERVEAIPTGGKVSEIIRNPVSADTPADTVNVAKITFEEERFDFGRVSEGTVVEHTFHFTNTGRVPLLISDARSTCGCTVPEWPKNPIPPGGKDSIVVRFNTDGKVKRQKKPVTITANTYPSRTVIHLEGYVEPKTQ
ncbi:MAG: DUF1573 domain-containing protein [Bacteroidetes bacterium]|nr:MAG: DUF1573 domain-containing protein [Bacteroidota bacterium]